MIETDNMKYKFSKEMLDTCLKPKNLARMNGDEKLFLKKVAKKIKDGLRITDQQYELLQEYNHRF